MDRTGPTQRPDWAKWLGKSNFLEAFGLLRATATDLMSPIREGGGIQDWIWKSSGSNVASVEVITPSPQGSIPIAYSLSIANDNGFARIADERIETESPFKGHKGPYLYFGYQNTRPMLNVKGSERHLQREDIDPQQSILSQRKDPDQYPEITSIGKQFGRIAIFREWSFGRNAPARLPQPSDGLNDFLDRDCSNLGLVLNRLLREPAIRKKLVKYLQQLYKGLDDFHINVDPGTVQVFLLEGDWAVPATRLSDGTLRYLCLLAILCHPTPPPMVCLEEPELGLHPDIIPTLAALMVDASSRTQLIVTTHSDLLVDELTESPESVLVCDRLESGTRIVRLSPKDLKCWLEEYRLGELWIRGDLGGTRW